MGIVSSWGAQMSAVPSVAPRPDLIRLTSVSKTYRRDGVPIRALRHVDVSIAEGEFVAIMGPSGSGKSTLLHILGLLDTEYEGTYRLGGRLVSGYSTDELSASRNREIGFVFQSFFLLPQLTILENAALPALYAGDRGPAECTGAARARLEQMHLGHRLSHRPNELSIGQRQRAAIARALVNDPRLLLADEPTGALDSRTARRILDIFVELHRAGRSVVLVTHDHDVASVADRIIHVRDGQTIDG
jgi:putative ABC transport system ATP-binding protein